MGLSKKSPYKISKFVVPKSAICKILHIISPSKTKRIITPTKPIQKSQSKPATNSNTTTNFLDAIKAKGSTITQSLKPVMKLSPPKPNTDNELFDFIKKRGLAIRPPNENNADNDNWTGGNKKYIHYVHKK